MKDESEIIAESRFLCAECAQETGHIQLTGSPIDAKLWRSSFTSVLTSAVSSEQSPRVCSALEQRDAQALYTLDLEYTPFYCRSVKLSTVVHIGRNGLFLTATSLDGLIPTVVAVPKDTSGCWKAEWKCGGQKDFVVPR